MREFVILADDFTGANDTGVQVRKQGIPIDVLLELDPAAQGEGSIVIDTESRVIPPTEAYACMVHIAEIVVQQGGCRYLYKKVDSTLRGNLKEEIKALLDIYKPELIVFDPAYPAQGRTVENRRLCVYGKPLLTTEIAADPRNPVFEDDIAQLLSSYTGTAVIHVTEKELASATMQLTSGAYTFDTTRQEQLEQIAKMVLRTGRKTLWIGSAGLAAGLLSSVYHKAPVLSVIGSVSSKTMEQIAYCQERGISVVCVDMTRICEGDAMEEAIRPAVDILQKGQDVIVTAAATRQDYETFLKYGKDCGKEPAVLAEITKQTLSAAVPYLLSKARICGIFLTGGDTAIAAIHRLQASGSHIDSQLLPGFVQGRLMGGICDGLPIVTKAGAFGTDSDIYSSMMKLKEIVG
ncbi:four-carbon acid sugar kinase family protein [Megasphaera sueciensis]|jgi:uncharacterized protein YgbK (DUF1537 family)|uniref:four-carbon acid sugar kinase family protein n=1 Tax=Megasphaera sueciensis TaxID=349094 RepID=UPI003CFE758B